MTEENQSLEVTTPAGSAKYSGTQLLPLLLVCAGCAAAWAITEGFKAANATAFTQQTIVIREEAAKTQLRLEELAKQEQASRESFARWQEAQMYILTLPERERQALRLQKPDLIRQLQR